MQCPLCQGQNTALPLKNASGDIYKCSSCKKIMRRKGGRWFNVAEGARRPGSRKSGVPLYITKEEILSH